jgi:hypothetical protein
MEVICIRCVTDSTADSMAGHASDLTAGLA